MATISKRVNEGGSVTWQVRLRKRGHAPIVRTFARKSDATAWAHDAESLTQKGGVISTEADNTTLGEALRRYAKEVTPRKKGADRELDRIAAWLRDDLSHRHLARLRGSDFAEYRDKRREDGVADGTIRLELALVSHMFTIASKEWNMEGLRNPIKSVTMPKPGTPRDRRLWPDEEAKLLPALAEIHPHLRPLAELAIETAMRQGELLALTWENVDLGRRVALLPDTKAGEPREVPLSTRAVEILKALPAHVKRTAPVFPVSQDYVIRSFAAACKTCEIEGLRFHDLRHEATSRICLRMSLQEAMKVTGHKTPSMLMRYFHPKVEDLAKKLG